MILSKAQVSFFYTGIACMLTGPLQASALPAFRTRQNTESLCSPTITSKHLRSVSLVGEHNIHSVAIFH